MTVQQLSQLYYLRMEVQADRERIRRLEEKIAPGAPDLSGMPKPPEPGRPTERQAAMIADLKAQLAERIQDCEREQQRLEAYISTIPDSLTRLIFRYRFSDCLRWDEVAQKLGGGNTPQGVKKRCYRYLRGKEEGKIAPAG